MNGASLKQFRSERSLNQTDLAKQLGISRRTLSTYEGAPDKDVPLWLALACAALAYKLPPMA